MTSSYTPPIRVKIFSPQMNEELSKNKPPAFIRKYESMKMTMWLRRFLNLSQSNDYGTKCFTSSAFAQTDFRMNSISSFQMSNMPNQLDCTRFSKCKSTKVKKLINIKHYERFQSFLHGNEMKQKRGQTIGQIFPLGVPFFYNAVKKVYKDLSMELRYEKLKKNMGRRRESIFRVVK